MLIQQEEKIKAYEYLLMFLLLALSGNPFFTKNLPEIISIASIIPIIYILRKGSKSISYHTLFIFCFFIGYELLHSIMFSLDYSLTIIKQFLVLLVSFTILDILKARFIKVLVSTMYYLSIISFVFTILCYVPGVNMFLYHLAETTFPLEMDYKGFVTPTLLLYTFHTEFMEGIFGYARNASIFWEAGAFAVYLNITLFLYYTEKGIFRISDLFDKKSIILIIAVISTTSTMGFLALSLVIGFFSFQLRTNLKYVLFASIVLAFFIAFHQIDYLGNKITEQLAESQTSNNRFGSALMDLDDVQERPIFGWSRRIEVLFDTNEFSHKTHRPNGLTNLLRNYGLLYFIVYFYFVFLTFQKIASQHSSNSRYLFGIFGVGLLWVVSFSEPIFDLAFLKCLIFLGYTYTSSNAQDSHMAEKIVSRKYNVLKLN